MRDRAMHNGYLYQVLLRVFNSFGNGFLNFLCLSQSMSYHSIFIAYYHQRGETECAAAFCCFYNTVYGYNFIFQFLVAGFYFDYVIL